jgi:glycosyltransferase involved in cell wall biosynthesis
MIINFISFLDPSVHHGGGEQITSALLEEGKRRGHTIHCTFQNPKKEDYNDAADLNILWDIFNCPEQNNPFNPDWLQHITADTMPYVYGTGGYEDLCTLGTLPCHGETDGETCGVPRSHQTFNIGGIMRPHPGKCLAKMRSSLLTGAKLCVFFSELHKEMIEKITGPLPSLVAIPPVKGLERYTNKNKLRDIELMSYGGQLEYKGFYNILEAYPDKAPLFIGGGPPSLPQLFHYGHAVGTVTQEDMPDVLNRVQTFIHMPRWPEPFGITTLQAALCGCEVIENENSVVLKDKNVQELVDDIKKWEHFEPFWEEVELL